MLKLVLMLKIFYIDEILFFMCSKIVQPNLGKNGGNRQTASDELTVDTMMMMKMINCFPDILLVTVEEELDETSSS